MWAEGGRECVFVTGSERESERKRERERDWPNSCSCFLPCAHSLAPTSADREYLWPGTCSPWLQAKATHWTWCAEVNLESHKTLLSKHKGLLCPPRPSLSRSLHAWQFTSVFSLAAICGHIQQPIINTEVGLGQEVLPRACGGHLRLMCQSFCFWGLANMACARVSLSECVRVHPEMLSLLLCVRTHLRLGSYQDSKSSESIIQRKNTTV